MSSNYQLTVKFASPGTEFFNQETKKLEKSTWGHVWLEARKPDEDLDAKPSFSAGWSTGRSKTNEKDNISFSDWENYRNNNDKQIDSISVDISKEQFEKLLTYPDLVANEKVDGFGTTYNPAWNSCIDFSGKGLSIIGLANKDFDGDGLEWTQPQKQIRSFLGQIVKYKSEDSAVTVKFQGNDYTLEDNENVDKFWDRVAPHWYRDELSMEERMVQENNHPKNRHYQFNSFDINNLPNNIHSLFYTVKGHLESYHEKNGLSVDEEKLQNSAMALAALGYSHRMTDATLFNVKDGQYLIGERNPVLNRVAMDIEHSASIPAEESLSQIQQTTQRFEYDEQQKQIIQSQSQAMKLS